MTKGRKYVQGEKVFAKVRGYPAWPARIVGAADESNNVNKIRYHIYFYGTGETAVVKGEDMYLFVEHRNGKLGKARKLKGFNEAMADIESNLSREEREQMMSFSGNDADVSMASDDGSSAASRASISNKTPKSGIADTPKSKSDSSVINNAESKVTKRKNDGDSHAPDAKKTKLDTDDIDEDATPKSDVISRAGRKIKQKKFSDDPSELEAGSKSTKTISPKQKSQSKPESNDIKESEDSIEFSYKNETVKIPLKAFRPTFNNPKSPVTWDRLVLQQAYEFKDQVISGELPPDKAVKAMEDWARSKAVDMAKTFEEDDKVCSALKTEGKLLSLDFKIKSSLTLNKADITACLQHMEELQNLQLSQVMLKKHPEVVETIKRLRRYVGNSSAWNYSDADLKEFKEFAGKVRLKADHIFSKFEALFIIPPGQTFWTVFSKQLEDFHKKTENLTEESVFLITKEPF